MLSRDLRPRLSISFLFILHWYVRPFIDDQLKNIRACVMTDHVEIELGPDNLTQIETSIQDALLIEQRTRDDFSHWGDDRAAASTHVFRLPGQFGKFTKIDRVHTFGDELVTAQHETASLAGDVLESGLPGVT